MWQSRPAAAGAANPCGLRCQRWQGGGLQACQSSARLVYEDKEYASFPAPALVRVGHFDAVSQLLDQKFGKESSPFRVLHADCQGRPAAWESALLSCMRRCKARSCRSYRGVCGKMPALLKWAGLIGVDWNDLVQPLLAISPGFALVFVLYIGFCFFALLNVIAGTYVEKVSRQAADLKARTQILKARRVFQAIDQDHSGYISLEEIQNQTATSVVLDFFESVDVDASEAQYLLEVLDMDGSGTIHFEEFLQGTIRLNSAARAADLLLVAREMKRFFHQSNLELQLIKKQLGM
ncbi:unnamed protein product [Effrenium voratum]|nr:unnamed protein product [Effrenium voratum]